jgi:hypothetical protein
MTASQLPLVARCSGEIAQELEVISSRATTLNRPHLLPLSTDDLLREKARLEALQPDAEDFDAVVVWKRQIDRISTAMRAEFVETVAEKRIVAMTAALASPGTN